MIRYLRSGKSPKEIAFIMGVSSWGIWKIIERRQEARGAYVDTYPLRHPDKIVPPSKVTTPLKLAVQ